MVLNLNNSFGKFLNLEKYYFLERQRHVDVKKGGRAKRTRELSTFFFSFTSADAILSKFLSGLSSNFFVLETENVC
jgi:hypothetical protein